jgi:hypothetical protein
MERHVFWLSLIKESEEQIAPIFMIEEWTFPKPARRGRKQDNLLAASS